MTLFGLRRIVLTCSNWAALKKAAAAGLVSQDPGGVFYFPPESPAKSIQIAALDDQIRKAMMRVGLVLFLFQ